MPALDRSIALASIRLRMTSTGVVSGAPPSLVDHPLLSLHVHGCVGRRWLHRHPVLRFSAGFSSVRRISRRHLDAILAPWIAPRCTILALGGLEPLARYAHEKGYACRSDTGRRDPRKPFGRRPPDRRLAHAAVGRFRVWIRRFRGIGAIYLENYLEWFRVVTSRDDLEPNPEALRLGPPPVAAGVRHIPRFTAN